MIENKNILCKLKLNTKVFILIKNKIPINTMQLWKFQKMAIITQVEIEYKGIHTDKEQTYNQSND